MGGSTVFSRKIADRCAPTNYKVNFKNQAQKGQMLAFYFTINPSIVDYDK